MAEEKEVGKEKKNEKSGAKSKSPTGKSGTKQAAPKKATPKKAAPKKAAPKKTPKPKEAPAKKSAAPSKPGRKKDPAKSRTTAKKAAKTAWKPEEIRETSGELAGRDGLLLKIYAWEPEDYKAAFLLVHGFGEHAGRYGFFRDYFLPRGYAVYSLDNRGHGQSAGRRGHVDSYDDYVEDLRLRALDALRDAAGRKVFLVGHSNGGLIALRYALAYPKGLAGVIVSGPLLRLAMEVPLWKSVLGQVAGRLTPTLTLGNEIVPERLSRDEEVQRAYMSDPLVHHSVSSRWFLEMEKAAGDALARAASLALPLLMLHGEADELCNVMGTRRFYHAVNLEDAALKTYAGFRHEIFNEIGKEQVFGDIEEWLKGRL